MKGDAKGKRLLAGAGELNGRLVHRVVEEQALRQGHFTLALALVQALLQVVLQLLKLFFALSGLDHFAD